jgi:hypothetical protein
MLQINANIAYRRFIIVLIYHILHKDISSLSSETKVLHYSVQTLYGFAYNVVAEVAQPVWCLIADCATGFRSRAEANDFFSRVCVQTSSDFHSASSYPRAPWALSQGVNCDRIVTLTIQPPSKCGSQE